MRVRVCDTNAETGEVTERWVEMPDVVDEATGIVQMKAAQQAEATIAGNTKTLEQQADTALANLRAYPDNASPTNAQTVAVVKTLCRVAIALIRLRLAKLDATD